jgi:phosphonate transport system ATP-binding protein
MLSVRRLGKSFGATRAVDGVTLDIPAGSFVGIIGRSGAGKSTLLRMINRLVDPTEGTIAFGGTNITALHGRDLRAWRARCAMVFQQFNLVDRLDVMTNVLLGRANNGVAALLKLWSADDKAIALTALEMFDMGRLAAQRAGTLSGGQQQRVAICRALVQEPDLILADEPVASLDPRSTRLVMDALHRVNVEFGITVLANLHSIDLARQYCDLYGLESDEITDGQAAGAWATRPTIGRIAAAH